MLEINRGPASMTPPILSAARMLPSARRVFGLVGALLAMAASAARAESRPERITVEPAEIRLEGAADRQQVAITGHFADGSVRDLTDQALLAVEPSGLAAVARSGV